MIVALCPCSKVSEVVFSRGLVRYFGVPLFPVGGRAVPDHISINGARITSDCELSFANLLL